MRFRVNSCRYVDGTHDPGVPGSFRALVTYRDKNGDVKTGVDHGWYLELTDMDSAQKFADDESTTIAVEFRPNREPVLLFDNAIATKEERKRLLEERLASIGAMAGKGGVVVIDAERDMVAELADQVKLVGKDESSSTKALRRLEQIRYLARSSLLARVLLAQDREMWQAVMDHTTENTKAPDVDPEADVNAVMEYLEANNIDVRNLTKLLLRAATQALQVEEILALRTDVISK